MRLCILLSTFCLLQPAVTEWQYDAQPFRVGTMRLICRADRPDLNLFEEWRDAQVAATLEAADNIRELCASRTWGGKSHNAGGTCEHSRDGTLAFDRTFGFVDRGTTIINDWRFMMYCRTKCICVNRGATSTPPRVVQHVPPTQRLLLDPESRFPIKSLPEVYSAVPFSRFVPITSIIRASRSIEPSRPISALLIKTTLITGNQQDDLVCQGELPWWDFHNKEDMSSLYSLCASTFIGGHRITNNGGRCGYTYKETWDVVFDIELQSSEYDDTMSGYCFIHCFCKNGEYKNPDRLIPWQPMAGFRITFDRREQVMIITNPVDGAIEKTSVYRDVRRSHHRPLTGGGGYQDASSAVSKGQQQPKQPSICRTASSCHGPQDCGGIAGCACVVDPKTVLYPTGQDPVFPQWACGWMAAAGALAGGASLSRNGLLGRGVQDPLCACNGTFVSKGCCESVDGLIWEDPYV